MSTVLFHCHLYEDLIYLDIVYFPVFSADIIFWVQGPCFILDIFNMHFYLISSTDGCSTSVSHGDFSIHTVLRMILFSNSWTKLCHPEEGGRLLDAELLCHITLLFLK